jgi:hypothetical protein
MAGSCLFGPCTITHAGVALGDTTEGGSFTIFTSDRVRRALGYVICKPVPRYGEGIIRMFSPIAGSIENTLAKTEYGSLILTGGDFTITMPEAKLLWPTNITFGDNAQHPFELGFFFRPTGGVLITYA